MRKISRTLIFSFLFILLFVGSSQAQARYRRWVIFKTISVSGQSDIIADNTIDTLNIAGGGITVITTNPATDTLTITSTEADTLHSVSGRNATTSHSLTTGGLTITTGNHLTLGIIRWDDGSDKIDGDQIADDTIDENSPDWGTGVGQISAVDLPIADTNTYFTGTEIETALEELGKTDELVNGSTSRPVDLSIVSDGTDITASLSSVVGSTITFKFSGGLTNVDVTTPITTILTAGTDTDPVMSYIYVLASDPTTLVDNTTGFPAATELCAIGKVVCQSATTLQGDGPLKQHTLVDDVANDASKGHLAHINGWIREQWGTWLTGVVPTFSGTGTATIGWASTVGTIRQLHKVTFPLFADGADVYCVNDPDTAYRKITNIADLQKDSGGNSLTNKTYALVFWGAASDDGQSKIFVNLPSDSEGLNQQSKVRADSGKKNRL